MTNVQLGRGGKVHYAGEPDGFMPSPVCGGNKASERYQVTKADVTCVKCLAKMPSETQAKASAEAQAEPVEAEAAPVEQYANVETTEGKYQVGQIVRYVGDNRPELAGELVEVTRAVDHIEPNVWGGDRFTYVVIIPGIPASAVGVNEREIEESNMTDGNDTVTVEQDETTTTVEQIKANIERAASLIEAENAEGLAELAKDTETLISSLPAKGRFEPDNVTFTALKKTLRNDWREAAQAQAGDKAKAKAKAEGKVVEVIDPKDYSVYKGVTELIAKGAAQVAEGVNLHLKTSTLAKDIAAVMLDIWALIPNKDGNPDIMGDSHAAKEAARAMYAKAGEGFTEDFDTVDALNKLQRAVQHQRSDVRAKFLRELDTNTEHAARFAKMLEAKPEDVPASKFVADAYDTALMGHGEIQKAKYRAKAGKATEAELKELEAAGVSLEETPEPELSADDRVKALVTRLMADAGKVAVDDFEAASEATKEAVRTDLEKLYDAVKKMISATL